MGFLVVNVTRGLVDGHYSDEDGAGRSAELWAEHCPGEYIVVCEIKKKIGPVGIPDNRFMAIGLGFRKARVNA